MLNKIELTQCLLHAWASKTGTLRAGWECDDHVFAACSLNNKTIA